MFEVERAISEWRQEIRSQGIKNSGILDELEIHLREDFEHRVGSGVEISRAFELARTCLGQTNSLTTEFGKARNTEMLIRLKNALLSLFGIPNYNLMTNMNATSAIFNVEPRWTTY